MKQQRDLTPVLAQLRSIKSDYELELLTRAGRIHEQVLIHDVAPFLHEGISEAELAVRLYLKMLLLGSHGVARTNRPTGEDVIGLASFGKVLPLSRYALISVLAARKWNLRGCPEHWVGLPSP